MLLAVTGSTGFLGRHLVAAALRGGHRVRALVRPGRAPAAGSEAVVGDLADLGALDRLVAGADAVLHLAAAGVKARDRIWEQLIRVNVEQPVALVEAAAEAKVRRFVAAGTCLEYRGHGTLPDRLAPPGAVCCETDPLEVAEPYGAAKAAGGLLLRARARDLGLPVWYLRLASVYGPGDDSEKLLPAAAHAARTARPFELSPGEQVREWLHVDDAIEALLAAAMTEPPGGVATLNVGTGDGRALREVVERLFFIAGAEATLVRSGARPYRRGEPHRLVMAGEAVRVALPGWRPRVNLDDGLTTLAGAIRREEN